MARVTALLYTASVLQLAPIVTGFAARSGFAGSRRWVAGWLALGVVFDALQLVLARSDVNNLWTTYFAAPLMGAVALYAMASWQRNDLARTAVWIMIPLSLVAWLFMLFTIETSNSFSLVVDPMYAILGLGVAVFTMGSRGLREDAPLLRQDWFWFCGGFALYYGAAAASSPFNAALVGARDDLVLRALTLSAATSIVAYVLVTIGFLCRTPNPSGVSSSRSPSAWGSWSSPSERLS